MPIPPSSSSVLSPEAGKIASPKTADDINDLFKSLDAEPEVKEPKPKEKEEPEPKEGKEDDELELVEDEEEVEKIDLSKDDELEIDTPPRKKEILKEYPELFKKFPFLEKVLYRDRQWNELFGSFDDAKELAEKSETFNTFESQLLAGNTEQILSEVKTADENAFNLIVDEYLPTLHKVDKEAYFHVVGNLNRRLIMEMVAEGNRTNNEELKNAALLVNQFVFGTAQFTAPTNRATKTDDKVKKEVEEERLNYTRERFETTRDELQSQVDNTLRATISEYIDPKNAMSPYVKKNAVADAMRILGAAISADSSVVSNLDRLWRAAFESKFSKDSQGKIKSYYLSKAKANLKSAILKARAEALKDAIPSRHNQSEVDDENNEETPARSARRIATGRPSQPRSEKNNGPKKGQSVTDYFMQD